MNSIRRLRARGFTLIELMIVVAIVGVLAALAVYGVRKYLTNAKTAEVRNAVGQIAKDAKASYERESMLSSLLPAGTSTGVVNNLCTDASSPVPSELSAVRGKKYQSAASEWSVDHGTVGKGFECLRFTISDPQYFMYSYFGSAGLAGAFRAQGNGDLDGDGVPSSFTIEGAVKNGTVLVSPNIAEASPDE